MPTPNKEAETEVKAKTRGKSKTTPASKTAAAQTKLKTAKVDSEVVLEGGLGEAPAPAPTKKDEPEEKLVPATSTDSMSSAYTGEEGEPISISTPTSKPTKETIQKRLEEAYALYKDLYPRHKSFTSGTLKGHKADQYIVDVRCLANEMKEISTFMQESSSSIPVTVQTLMSNAAKLLQGVNASPLSAPPIFITTRRDGQEGYLPPSDEAVSPNPNMDIMGQDSHGKTTQSVKSQPKKIATAEEPYAKKKSPWHCFCTCFGSTKTNDKAKSEKEKPLLDDADRMEAEAGGHVAAPAPTTR